VTELTPGFYTLANDVRNPLKIDRRRSLWPQLPVFKAGTRFGARFDWEHQKMLLLSMVGTSFDVVVNGKRDRHKPLVGALAAELVREEPTLEEVLWVNHSKAMDVLRILRARGVLSLEWVDGLLKERGDTSGQ